jgi:hypothetical protein
MSNGYIRVIKQVLREFCVPFVVALVWTLWVQRTSEISAAAWIANFGSAFFLSSWMTGQLVRIRRQARVEDGLSTLEERLSRIAQDLDAAVVDLQGYMSGGDSYCYFSPSFGVANSRWIVVQSGKYPLYNVAARVVDLSLVDAAMRAGDPMAFDRHVETGDLPNGQALFANIGQIPESSSLDLNIFFSAKNGFFTQLFRARDVEGEMAYAYQVRRNLPDGRTICLHKSVGEAYPLSEDGTPAGFSAEEWNLQLLISDAH